MHNGVTGCVTFTSNKADRKSQKVKQLKKFYQRSYIIILTGLSNAIEHLWEKISLYQHFNLIQSIIKFINNS